MKAGLCEERETYALFTVAHMSQRYRRDICNVTNDWSWHQYQLCHDYRLAEFNDAVLVGVEDQFPFF